MTRLYRIIGKSVRGSAQYWASAKKQALSMINGIGYPSLQGSNDLKWADLFMAIDPDRFRTAADIERLSEEERVQLLNKFPAIAAEHYANRVRAFISDYFIRIEFQMRGSPHIHGFLWLEDVPDPIEHPAEYLKFVDSVISARLPDKNEDPQLFDLVNRYQRHNHTFTCETAPKIRNKKSRDVLLFRERTATK
eukprot:TRINITY_DN9776_c0_g1_i3.p1 TRINITY_DN9776_c0_g1~~TRINITY_DN9776_c0_g1_i3.p1  ORF type:complete len:193 (+),score=26.07 TRINITY_DN9776_c0_g1_i3:721-1299(+)